MEDIIKIVEWPCDKCTLIQKHPYGHYYSICDGCPELEEYELWVEQQELKRAKDKIMMKSKFKNLQEEKELGQ